MLSNKISRQLTIINILSENTEGLTKEEIIKTIEYKFELANDPFNYLELTFKRDLQSIRNDFNIDVIYNKKDNTYQLGSLSVDDSRVELLLNSFKIFTIMLNHSGLPEYIIPEKRKSNGLKNISIITDAIGSKKYILFEYFKYDSSTYETKKIKPFALKESKNRWYVIGSYEGKTDLRAFGLDRISKLEVLDQAYKTKFKIEDIDKYYEDSFAMFSDGKTENVTLSFDFRDGNYINSYPIHHSQECEIDTENNRYIVKLKLKITLDFIMELMSRAWSLDVIEPLYLRNKMEVIFKEAFERNKN